MDFTSLKATKLCYWRGAKAVHMKKGVRNFTLSPKTCGPERNSGDEFEVETKEEHEKKEHEKKEDHQKGAWIRSATTAREQTILLETDNSIRFAWKENQWIIYPFDVCHVITSSKIIKHFRKCERYYTGPPLAQCRYAASHRMPAQELEAHELACPLKKWVCSRRHRFLRHRELTRLSHWSLKMVATLGQWTLSLTADEIGRITINTA
uniref:CHHC U11-48K-type domain-containing protein n=1 Tax=Branchiostoma floridae TaxID=7739 RepID=C3YYM7_BRAFL|eukprot:XP_002598655.1 hypothetical protein BRAFLDRAFT_67055 [Branchiostoma floridae]